MRAMLSSTSFTEPELANCFSKWLSLLSICLRLSKARCSTISATRFNRSRASEMSILPRLLSDRGPGFLVSDEAF